MSVGEPPQHRRPRGFERRRDEVGRTHCGGTPAEIPQTQRDKDRQRPEAECGEEAEPDSRLDRPVAPERVHERRERLRSLRDRRGRRGGDSRENECEPCDCAERRPGSGEGRNRSEHGAEKRTRDRRPERGADQLAAPSRRRGSDEPAQCAGPRERTGDSLQEAGEVERPDRIRQSKGDRRESEEREPDQHRGLHTEPCRGDPARNAGEESTRRIHGLQHTGAGFPEVELVHVVGQQRRERREEHGVDQDNRPGQ